MDTQITLYRVPISRQRNCRIDGINAFLQSNSKSTLNNSRCGYVAIDYRIAISLSMPQANVGKLPYNYCRIYQDNRNYYYFINKASWMSKQSVALTLTLDTINTFWDDFKWSQKTTIIREHRDRWTKSYRIIDRFNEGLNPALDQLSTPKEVPTKTNAFNNYGKCYLVWLANAEITPEKQSATPMNACLLFDNAFTYLSAVQSSVDSYTISNTNLVYYITTSMASGTIRIFYGTTQQAVIPLGADFGGEKVQAVKIYANAGVWHSVQLRYTGDTYPFSFKEYAGDTAIGSGSITVKIQNSSTMGIRRINFAIDTETSRNYTSLPTIDNLGYYSANIGYQKELKTSAFENFDRSSTFISSIIQIPYAPIEDEASIFGFVPGFNLLKLTYRQMQNMSRKMTDSDFYKNDIGIDPPAAAYNSINKDYESKLYSSEFYQRIYSYGDDQEVIRYEMFNVPKYSLDITWQISSNMTNDFRFFFNLGIGYERMDIYNDYIFISESSQIPLYNSSYIDYIRNGYNYDSYVNKKNNQLSVINAIGNGLSTGISLIGGGAVGPGIVAGRAIQYGLKGLSAAASIDSNNRQFQKIVNEKASTSPTVTGNSSIDLRPYNKLMVYTKSLREEVRDQIFWKFFYTGYSHPCQEIPDTESRHWFNYIECYPVFKEEEASVYSDFLDEIRGRFQEGITVFHNRNNVWNINQDKENVEEVLL